MLSTFTGYLYISTQVYLSTFLIFIRVWILVIINITYSSLPAYYLGILQDKDDIGKITIQLRKILMVNYLNLITSCNIFFQQSQFKSIYCKFSDNHCYNISIHNLSFGRLFPFLQKVKIRKSYYDRGGLYLLGIWSTIKLITQTMINNLHNTCWKFMNTFEREILW